jgi:Domain of unknown function (DUF4160)
MSPTVMRIGPYRFFFNSREETRKHVHVALAGGTAKFWLEPVVALESYHDLSPRDLRDVDLLVREHEDEFKSAWDRHFSS